MLNGLEQFDWNQWWPLVAVFSLVTAVVFTVGRWLVRPGYLSKDSTVGGELAVIPPAFGSLTEPLSQTFPHTTNKRDKIQRELSDAGYHHRNALINFLSLRNVGSMAWLMLVAIGFFVGLADGIELNALLTAAAIAVFIHSVPRIILSTQASGRLRQIEQGLPDALDMLAMSVEGGLPMEPSLERVAGELGVTHAALASELNIIARQSVAGSFDVALKSFADRIQLPELMAWSAMMQQSQRLGGNVVNGLREYADRIRNSRKQRAERIGQTASVKLLLPVVLCLTPPVFIILVGPAMLDFRDFIQRERENQSAVIEDASAPSGPSARRSSNEPQVNRGNGFAS